MGRGGHRSRFPAISDANYARIDAAAPDLTAAEVEAALLPAIAKSGAGVMHAVSFHPQETEGLFAELAARGHRRSSDLVMDLRGDPPVPTDVRVEEPDLDADFWARVEASFALFGVEPHETAVQLLELERALERTGAKRWFTVRDGDGRRWRWPRSSCWTAWATSTTSARSRRRAGEATRARSPSGRPERRAMPAPRHVTLLADPGARR